MLNLKPLWAVLLTLIIEKHCFLKPLVIYYLIWSTVKINLSPQFKSVFHAQIRVN